MPTPDLAVHRTRERNAIKLNQVAAATNIIEEKEDTESVGTRSELESTEKLIVEKAPDNAKINYEKIKNQKHLELRNITYLQKVILADLGSIVFGLSGLLYEMYSVNNCNQAKRYYDSNVVRVPATDTDPRYEFLSPATMDSSFAYLQMLSTLTTVLCIIGVYLSYGFEVKSLIERNLVNRDGRLA